MPSLGSRVPDFLKHVPRMKQAAAAGSLVKGLLAVGLAGAGETAIRSKNDSGLGGALYFLAIVLFAIGAYTKP